MNRRTLLRRLLAGMALGFGLWRPAPGLAVEDPNSRIRRQIQLLIDRLERLEALLPSSAEAQQAALDAAIRGLNSLFEDPGLDPAPALALVAAALAAVIPLWEDPSNRRDLPPGFGGALAAAVAAFRVLVRLFEDPGL